jgi:hypothetical protein
MRPLLVRFRTLLLALVSLSLASALAVGCSSQVPATQASVAAVARDAAREVGPTPEDTQILDVDVASGEATVTATGTIVDYGAIVYAPAEFGDILMRRLFSRTSVRSVTLIWGPADAPVVRVRYERAQWERSGGAADEGFFTSASEYRWLDEDMWREATAPADGISPEKLPIASGN